MIRIKKNQFLGIMILLFLLFAKMNFLSAQGISISGMVLSEDSKEQLIGAVVSNGTETTVTDIEGRFTLNNIHPEDSLFISYVGFENLTIYLGPDVNPLQIVIALKPSQNLLETATVTSGKFDKALGEITVSMEILKPKLIEDINTKSLDQVLEKIPGVTIIDGQPNIRGGSGYSYGAGSRVLLLIDDIPALTSDAGFPNWEDIPVELTNQVEILKGASSALYGSSAMNGIINLRTDYAKEESQTKIASYVTLYEPPKDKAKQWWANDKDTIPLDLSTYITHKQKFGKLDFVGSVFIRDHKEWHKNIVTAYQRGAIGLRYRLNNNWTIGLNGNVRNGKNNSFLFWQNQDSLALVPSNFTQSEAVRAIVDPYVQYVDDNGNRHKFQSRIYSVNNNLTQNQSNSSNLYYGEYQYQKRFLSSNLVLSGGLVGSTTNVDAELYSNSEFTSNNLAAYLQADKKFFDKLNLSLGLRYERNQINAPDSIPINGINTFAGTDTESKPVFRLGANYQLGKYTFLRGSFGQGYRFPTIAEKYISTQVGFTISPNLDLRSESGWSAEIGLKQGIKINNFKGLFDIAVFQSEYQDMMEFTFSNIFAIGFQSLNVGNTIIRGLDFNIAGSGEIFSGFPISALIGYTYLDPKFKEFGEMEMNGSTSDRNILKYRFQHTGKLDIATNFEKFNLGIAGFYYSELEAIDALLEFFVNGLADYRDQNNSPFAIWNLRASFKPWKKVKCSILWNNVFNKEYTLRPALIEAPRNLSLRVDFDF